MVAPNQMSEMAHQPLRRPQTVDSPPSNSQFSQWIGRHRRSPFGRADATSAAAYFATADDDDEGGGHDHHHESASRAFLFGGQESPAVFSAFIGDYHNRLGAGHQARGLQKYAVLAAAGISTGSNDAAHLIGEKVSSPDEHSNKVVAASALGLGVSSIPTVLTYLVTGDPHLTNLASAATFGGLGVVGSAVEARDGEAHDDHHAAEPRHADGHEKLPKWWKRGAFWRAAVGNVGVQAGAGMSAMGLGMYGGAVSEGLEKGLSLTNAMAQSAGNEWLIAGVGAIVLANVVRLVGRKRTEKAKFTKRDRLRAATMAGQEGAQMAGVNATIAQGLKAHPKVALAATVYQSLVNGLIHAGGEAASNPDGKRWKAAVTAFGAIGLSSLLPLGMFYATGSFLGATAGSVLSMVGLGAYNAREQARSEGRALQRGELRRAMWKQVKAGSAGIFLAYVGSTAVEGGLSGGVSGIWEAVSGNPVSLTGLAAGSVLALRGVRKQLRKRKGPARPGTRRWGRYQHSLEQWERRADVLRHRLGVSGDWQSKSSALRALHYPKGSSSAELKVRASAKQRLAPFTLSWHIRDAALTFAEQQADGLRERMSSLGSSKEAWKAVSASLTRLRDDMPKPLDSSTGANATTASTEAAPLPDVRVELPRTKYRYGSIAARARHKQSAAWRRFRRRVSRWESRADKQRRKLDLASGWRTESATLRAWHHSQSTPLNDLMPKGRRRVDVARRSLAWHIRDTALSIIENRANRLRERINLDQSWAGPGWRDVSDTLRVMRRKPPERGPEFVEVDTGDVENGSGVNGRRMWKPAGDPSRAMSAKTAPAIKLG